ncbi:MAG TPA: hypothetical protein ENN17_00135 [bacterium]|nr:hypothetical protein [bacterium]
MTNVKHDFAWGLFLIVFGVVFLIGNLNDAGMALLWPLLLLAPALGFWIGYFLDRKNYGLVMPGTILAVVGLFFLYLNLSGWHNMTVLWPVFLLAPAAGFVSLYIAGPHDPGLFWPAGILGGLGVIFLFFSTGFGDLWPVFLIVVGVLMILKSRGRAGSTDSHG